MIKIVTQAKILEWPNIISSVTIKLKKELAVTCKGFPCLKSICFGACSVILMSPNVNVSVKFDTKTAKHKEESHMLAYMYQFICRVQLGTLSDFVSTSCVSKLNFIRDIEEAAQGRFFI